MRIAAISDIHGNLPALEAALDHVERQQVDQVVVVGDVVMGSPDSKACWDTVCELGCPVVKGNGESYMARYGTAEADPQWETEQFGPMQWAANEFTEDERRALGDLPLTYRPPDTHDILFFHASPRSEYESMKAYTPEDELEEMFAGVDEGYLVRGHQHNLQVRLWNSRAIINCGSVGLPVDYNPDAQYVLLDQRKDGWHVRHQAVPYDVDALLRRVRETDYMKVAGPMGRLHVRAVATGTNQIMAFLRYYKKWQSDGDIGLGEAVDRFLNLY